VPNIKISELRPVGSELFQDSESFLNELNEQEMSTIEGGKGNIIITSAINIISQASISQGISVNTVSAVTR
jgi:bacteriocin-like protein